jgi:hypothetical protein
VSKIINKNSQMVTIRILLFFRLPQNGGAVAKAKHNLSNDYCKEMLSTHTVIHLIDVNSIRVLSHAMYIRCKQKLVPICKDGGHISVRFKHFVCRFGTICIMIFDAVFCPYNYGAVKSTL